MQEAGTDVHVVDVPTLCSCKGDCGTKGGPFDYKGKGFVEVDAVVLFETASHKACFLHWRLTRKARFEFKKTHLQVMARCPGGKGVSSQVLFFQMESISA